MAKQKTSKELGFYSIQDNQSATISGEEPLKLISKYNKDPKIHGIPVQLPLPKYINETKILYAIAPKKDVDGFHPVNVGKLMIGEADYLPCTQAGIQQLLIRSSVKIDVQKWWWSKGRTSSENRLPTSSYRNRKVPMPR